MLSFHPKDVDGRFYSECRKYFIQCTGDIKSKGWMACKLGEGDRFTILARDVDHEEARWVCEDEKYRYPCGCILRVRPAEWKHCPLCGAKLPPPKPYVPPPPKPERKVKEPNRPEWLVKYSGGCEHGYDWDCVYEGKNWAVIRIPGYTSWCSVGATSYGPTTYEVVRRTDHRGMHIQKGETEGLTSLLKAKRFAKDPANFVALTVHEGRAKKDDLARFRAMVDELDAKGL